jgi:methionine sulfoxide reductase heme-binding subunit
MSAGYQPVLWNAYKKKYDLALWSAIILYLVIFIGSNIVLFPTHNFNTILIRAFGTLAILLLHIVLLIGPLCRLSSSFLPLLYNRRHFGVSLFLVAAVHGILSLTWFHGNADVDPLLSLFTANRHYASIAYFPFQTLGFGALLILAAMAFTSHDFWLSFLGPRFWKAMHMFIYVAYGLVIMHVALGIIQFEKSPALVILLIAGLLIISIVHLAAAVKETGFDKRRAKVTADEHWQFVGLVNDIPESRAKIVVVDGERVAVFRYDGKISAVHNVCKHQMGPLGEGRVVDGCITCPWHGYQYRPEDGCAPPPFTEKLHTYIIQLRGDQVFIKTTALPEGTLVEPAITGKTSAETQDFFVGWEASHSRRSLSSTKKAAIYLSILLFATSFLLVTQQRRVSAYQIDYDDVKNMEGWLSDEPIPTLTVIDGRDGNGNPILKSILLVDAFKHGARETVAGVLGSSHDAYVRVQGYMSHHYVSCSNKPDSTACCTDCVKGTSIFPLMEIENGVRSFEKKKAPFEVVSRAQDQGVDTILNGEIVDPKCYFGAMNPGQGKTHLSCAVRCISGGIMPMLKWTSSGKDDFAIIVLSNGKPANAAVVGIVGLPATLHGKLVKMNNWHILYMSPDQAALTSKR